MPESGPDPRRSPLRRDASIADLVAASRQGNPRAVARLVSLVEDRSPLLRQVMAALAPYSGQAQVIGLTGSPGVGKSTTTSALVAAYRARGRRVGVLAVDPSSPFSGGALLGDRVRMQDHATDPGVFIRSMASRGHLGGLAWATPQALRVLDAAGCEVVLVETVGVGQSEVEVAGAADTTVRELTHMLALGERVEGAWQPPVLKTVAARGEGIDELVDALEAHHAWLAAHGGLHRRRAARAAGEIEAIALDDLRERIGDLRGGRLLDDLAAEVVAGSLDPYSAADRLVDSVTA